jgi:hypothetical protein
MHIDSKGAAKRTRPASEGPETHRRTSNELPPAALRGKLSGLYPTLAATASALAKAPSPSDASSAQLAAFVEAIRVTRHFATSLGEDSRTRTAYLNETRDFARAIRQRLDDGELTEGEAAHAENAFRNQALPTAREGMSPAGRALSVHVKQQHTTLAARMEHHARALHGRSLRTLTVEEQGKVCLEVAKQAGITEGASAGPNAVRPGTLMVAAAIALAVYQVAAAEEHGGQRGPSLPGLWTAEPFAPSGAACIPATWLCAPLGGLLRAIAGAILADKAAAMR